VYIPQSLENAQIKEARRWLPKGHPYKTEAMKAHFDGQFEFRNKPMTVTIEE
jgi:hypothetical protein